MTNVRLHGAPGSEVEEAGFGEDCKVGERGGREHSLAPAFFGMLQDAPTLDRLRESVTPTLE